MIRLSKHERDKAFKWIMPKLSDPKFKAKQLVDYFREQGITKSLRQCQKIVLDVKDVEAETRAQAYLNKYGRINLQNISNETILQELGYIRMLCETLVKRGTFEEPNTRFYLSEDTNR